MKASASQGATDRALRERVKELTCLYAIAQLASDPGIALGELLQRIAETLPAAWQYPEVAAAAIVLDGRSYATPGYRQSRWAQEAEIVVNGAVRGAAQVIYSRRMPTLTRASGAEGPFLLEERSLLDAVAAQVAQIVERKESEVSAARLQEQLRHADRLATIGQLAAGVAHELNEPLGNILGFAQLAMKCPGVPGPAQRDLGKIETAALHAREVIRKLLLFARQTPPHKERVRLNQVIQDGLFLFEARCAKAGVEIEHALAPDLPEITADPGQINQALVNLVVNALQAMPQGGRLTIATSARDGQVSLVVQDTGQGMNEQTLAQIFVPFFTTKDIGEGTGLGLPMVHGIVTAHGGTIHVESQPGRGARFEIRLPVASGVEPPVALAHGAAVAPAASAAA